MAKAAADGHRVVLVVATRGEHGEVAEGFLDARRGAVAAAGEGDPGRRRDPGRARVEFLGYVDSGMIGTPENDLPESLLAGRRGGGGRAGWRPSSTRSRPTSSPPTTRTASTATPTTSRCTGWASAPPSWPARRGLHEHRQQGPHEAASSSGADAGRRGPGDLTRRTSTWACPRSASPPRSTCGRLVRKRAAMAAHASQISRDVVLPGHGPGACSTWPSARSGSSAAAPARAWSRPTCSRA